METNASNSSNDLHGHETTELSQTRRANLQAPIIQNNNPYLNIYNNNPNVNNMYGSGSITNNNQITNHIDVRPRTPPATYARSDIPSRNMRTLI